jgi:urea transport system permease protein
MSLLGAVYGTLAVNYGKTYFSETLPELWLFLMGGLFLGVVLYFPNGIAGLWASHGKAWFIKMLGKSESTEPTKPTTALPNATSTTSVKVNGVTNKLSMTGLEASK